METFIPTDRKTSCRVCGGLGGCWERKHDLDVVDSALVDHAMCDQTDTARWHGARDLKARAAEAMGHGLEYVHRGEWNRAYGRFARAAGHWLDAWILEAQRTEKR